jgi:equilibrative nucleoside transporter 1/2/3
VNGLLLIATIWAIIYGGKYSFTIRIVSTFMLSAIILVTIPLLAQLGNAAGFWSVFIILFFFSFISGVCQASVFSLAGGLPYKYMGAVMLGQGFAGIICNIIRALSLIIWPIAASQDNILKGIAAYILFASLFMVVCGLC